MRHGMQREIASHAVLSLSLPLSVAIAVPNKSLVYQPRPPLTVNQIVFNSIVNIAQLKTDTIPTESKKIHKMHACKSRNIWLATQTEWDMPQTQHKTPLQCIFIK